MFDVGGLKDAKAGSVFETTVDRLHDELAAVAGVWHAAAGQLVLLAATALRHELWSISGVHTPEQWLAWQCGISAGRARQIVAIARRAEELPVCVAALAAGEISLDHAAVIVRHAPSWADGAVADLAKQTTVSQLSRVVRAYGFDRNPGADPDASVRRAVRFGTVDEHQWRMIVETNADEGAVFEQALVAFRDRLFCSRQSDAQNADDHGSAARNGDEQLCDVSWLDAFGEMVEHALAHDGEVREHPERSRVLFHYEVDLAGNPVMAAHGHAPMPDALRRLWTCDAAVVPVAHRQGYPVNVGRAQRIVPRRLRVLLEHRDGGCRVPGCTHTRWVQIHHIVHWEQGGSTNAENLISLCGRHHRLHHRGLLGIEGNADQPDGLMFTDQRGRRLTCRSQARPPDQPLHAAAKNLGINGANWEPPLGEHLDHWCIDLGRPPPRAPD